MPGFQPPLLTMTTDIVIFSIRDDRLEILLIQRGRPPFQGQWALPGGLVEVDEDVDVCAHRELEEETGLKDLELEQFHVFGAPGRDPRGRYVTVAYLTLVRSDRLAPRAASDAAGVDWFAVDALPSLAFDHGAIIAMARQRLLRAIEESPLAFGYLPEGVTLEELRRFCHVVSGHPLDPATFRKKAIAREWIKES